MRTISQGGQSEREGCDQSEHNFENSNKRMLMFVKKGLVLGPAASETAERDAENELMVAGGGEARRRDSEAVRHQQVHTPVFKIGNQQGRTLQHMGLCSVSSDGLDVLMRAEFGGEWTNVYV